MVLCQLEIKQILVIDFYGGAKNVSVKEYYSYKPKQSTFSSTEQKIVSQIENEFPAPKNHAKVARDLVHAASKSVPLTARVGRTVTFLCFFLNRRLDFDRNHLDYEPNPWISNGQCVIGCRQPKRISFDRKYLLFLGQRESEVQRSHYTESGIDAVL